jgi:uncharacterized phage protein (TIGR01671 family)
MIFSDNVGLSCFFDNISSFLGDVNKISQFTGLIDINGKEIYEGDIIKYFNRVAQIKYSDMDACFYLLTEYDKQSFSLCHTINDSKKDLEIIGNIFENPELIK